jgi:hypothetical protein
MKQQFDGEQEKELPPTHRDRKFVFKMATNIRVVFEKRVKKNNERERKRSQSRMCHLKTINFL